MKCQILIASLALLGMTGPARAQIVSALTPRQEQVRQIAIDNGDHDFLMIDKAQGRIVVVEGDQPVAWDAILTGASTADQYPAAVLRKHEGAKLSTAEKITPAGRFTLRRTFDPTLGPAFELREIHGVDWWLAIHRVWTGIPSEHRRERLMSNDPDQMRVTFGCMNVMPATMTWLLEHLPAKGTTPLYILPFDAPVSAALFQPPSRQAMARPAGG